MKVIPFTIPVPKDKSIIIQEDRLPYFYNHLHRHHEIQITWIQQGEGTLLVGESMHHFQPGDVFVIGANQPHIFKSDASYFEKRNKKISQSVTIFFNENGDLEPLLKLPELKLIRKWLEQFPAGCKLPQASQTTIIKLIQSVGSSKGSLQIARFIELLQAFASNKGLSALSTLSQPLQFNESEGARLNTIYQYTLEHFSESISLNEVAAKAHLTVPAFCRYFKKRTRKTYVGFLNEIRISEACKLLQQEPESMVSIAFATGFSHISSFNRTFKQIMGISPREFKNRSSI